MQRRQGVRERQTVPDAGSAAEDGTAEVEQEKEGEQEQGASQEAARQDALEGEEHQDEPYSPDDEEDHQREPSGDPRKSGGSEHDEEPLPRRCGSRRLVLRDHSPVGVQGEVVRARSCSAGSVVSVEQDVFWLWLDQPELEVGGSAVDVSGLW